MPCRPGRESRASLHQPTTGATTNRLPVSVLRPKQCSRSLARGTPHCWLRACLLIGVDAPRSGYPDHAMPQPAPTIRGTDICEDDCKHCAAVTVQVIGGAGLIFSDEEGAKQGRACLQCIADGGTCCSLASLSRYLTHP